MIADIMTRMQNLSEGGAGDVLPDIAAETNAGVHMLA